MSRIKLGKNMFGDLADSDDESDGFSSQQSNTTASTPKPEFQPGAKRQPMTFTQIFEKSSKGRDPTSLNELSNILEESLRIRQEERTLYCDKYETYEKFDPKEYDELLDKRINCFETRSNDQDFINLVVSKLPQNAELNEVKQIMDNSIEKLSKKKQTGHGALFLIDLLFQYRPQIFNNTTAEARQNFFYVEHEKISIGGPPTLWLLSRAISQPSKVKLSTNVLVSIFIDELLDTSDKSISGPYSVWASHLIERSINQNNDCKISARNYARIIELFLRLYKPSLNCDVHIKTVLQRCKKFQISDLDNYPREIMTIYPNFEESPKQVKIEFIERARKSPTFLNGWISCHNDPEIHAISMKYLDLVSRFAPSILDSFPVSDIAECTNDVAELKLKDRELFKTSIRFTVVAIATAAAVFLKINVFK